ncbi:MAG: FkbM family methyltransferase [Pseudomonadota bacterium]
MSSATTTLPPPGTPADAVVSAVEAIVAGGALDQLEALRAAAATRADLSAGVAITLLRQGRKDDAVALLRRFIDSVGADPLAYDALGAIHLASDDAEAAIAAFRAALDIDPEAQNAASNLYNVLLNLRRYAEAVDVRARYTQAADGAPDRTVRAAQKLMINGEAATAIALLEPIANTPAANCALGEAYFRRGWQDKAHEAWDAALEADPDHLQTLIKRAIGLNLQQKVDAALESIDRAAELDADSLSVRVTRAAILTEKSRSQEAIDILEDTLEEENEAHADGWAILSKAYIQLGLGAKAKEAAEKSLTLEENNFFGRQNLVVALLRCHDNRAAEREARKTVELVKQGHYRLGFNVSSVLFSQLDMLGQSMSRQGMANVAHEMRQEYIDDPQVGLQFFQNYLFELHYTTGVSAEFIGSEHRKIRRLFAPERPLEKFSKDPTKRLKVGFLSGDFRHHSCGYFMFSLISGLKLLDVDVVCVANHYAKDDDLTDSFREIADEWVDIDGLDMEAARDLIIETGVDILVDCVGYTAGARTDVLAARAAPIQVTWLGYPNGSGLDSVDYRFTDRLAEPPNADAYYSEELIRLPRGFLCFPEYDGAPDVSATPAMRNGYVTFGCFNGTPKLNDDVMQAWARIIQQTPNSRLLLKGSYIEEDSVEALRVRFVEAGVPEDAIDFMPWTATKVDHLRVYNTIDVNLDPFPYNGTTTTMEATFMGVPSVVLRGDRHSALVGVALMTRFGMPELIGEDIDDYVRIAVDLAQDVEKLNTLRSGVRDRMRASEIMSNQVFAQDVFDAFRTMWIKHCESHGAETKAATMASDVASLDVTTRSGVTISVPATMRELSTYILLEQEDWFELELPFLAGIAQPDWRMLDIGANYGIYSLSIAQSAGEGVKIAAFEPAARTSSFLRRSVDKNAFDDRIDVVQAAMSDSVGEAVLDLGAAELKALTTSGRGETVRTFSLDAWAAETQDFKTPDFIKMDAEGAEAAILQGGAEFLASADPLIMMEVKHNAGHNFEALDILSGYGYELFALAPGLNLLAPADPRASVLAPHALDSYCLNLFGCKAGMKASLAAQGVLVEARVDAVPDAEIDLAKWSALLERCAFWPAFHALQADFIDPSKALPGADDYKRALARAALAEDVALSPDQRLAELEAAHRDVQSALSYRRSVERLVTAARIALTLGRRDFAVRVLREAKLALSRLDLTIDEPFLPALARYDGIDARPDFIGWFEASVLEAYEVSAAFSSFFSGERAFDIYEALKENPFASPEMLRRHRLQRLRHRLDGAFAEEPRLVVEGPEHANANLWRSSEAFWAA